MRKVVANRVEVQTEECKREGREILMGSASHGICPRLQCRFLLCCSEQ
jgi:hypothetical protein